MVFSKMIIDTKGKTTKKENSECCITFLFNRKNLIEKQIIYDKIKNNTAVNDFIYNDDNKIVLQKITKNDGEYSLSVTNYISSIVKYPNGIYMYNEYIKKDRINKIRRILKND